MLRYFQLAAESRGAPGYRLLKAHAFRIFAVPAILNDAVRVTDRNFGLKRAALFWK